MVETGLAVIFLIMTTLRIWFDLAEVDTVLNDERTLRKSIASALGHTFQNVYGAFMIGQITLFLLLIPRFWQGGSQFLIGNDICWLR